MGRYVVTRHQGAAAWAERHAPEAVVVDHLDPARVAPGDVVMGNLPVHVAAEVCARGGTFLHLALDPAPERRGSELTVRELEAAGARLVAYDVVPLGAEALPAVAPEETVEERAARLSHGAARYGRFLLGFAALTAIVMSQAGAFELVKAAYLDPATAAPTLAGAGGLALAGSLVAYLLYRLRHRVLSSVIRRSDRVPPARAIIQGLSDLPSRTEEERNESLRLVAQARRLSLAELVLSRMELEGAEGRALAEERRDVLLDLSRGQLRWHQNLRALRPHLATLEHLVVLTTEQSDTDFELFACLVRHAFAKAGRRVRVHRAPAGKVEFEEHEMLEPALRGAFALVQRELRIPLHAISVDVTAGQKIFSITAAIATINRNLVFTYVNNKGVVRAFDASIELGDFG